MKDLKTALNDLAKARGYKTEGLSDKELFQLVTGIQQPSDEMMSGEFASWYVPGGAAVEQDDAKESEGKDEEEKPVKPTAAEVAEHIGEDVTDENKQFDVDNDGDIDEDDVTAANSTVIVDEDPTEEPAKQESDAWTYVNDATTFNASLAGGGLAKYYEAYPDEDLESTTGAGNATFNDRIYVGSFDNSNEVVEFKAGWEETSQKITNVADSTEVYYMERIDGQGNQYAKFQGESWTLYTDAALTTEAGHVFHITRLEFDGFEHTYNAAANATGSTLPWVVVNFSGEETHTVEFEYDGTAIPAQWDHAINWGIVSVANDLGIVNFDEAKLKMYIAD